MITQTQCQEISEKIKDILIDTLYGKCSDTAETISNISMSILSMYSSLQFSFKPFSIDNDVISNAIVNRLMYNSKHMLLTYNNLGIVQNLLPWSKSLRNESKGFTESENSTNNFEGTSDIAKKRADEESVINSTDDVYVITNPTNKVNQSENTKGSTSSDTSKNIKHDQQLSYNDEIISPALFREYFENLSTTDLYSVVRRSIDYFIIETDNIIF